MSVFFVLEFPVFLSKTGRLRINQPLINSRLRKGTGESALYLELMGADSQCSKIFINHLGPQNTFQHDSVEPNLKRQSDPLVKNLSTELNIAKLTATIYVSRKQ